MLKRLAGAIPRHWFDPFRRTVVSVPRGTIRRNICVAILKFAGRGHAGCHGLTEVRPLDRTDLSFEAADSMVMDSVYWFGTRGYEGILVDVWQTLSRRSQDILEIGGNVGFYSVIGGKVAGGRYTVLEPVPAIAALLRANLRRNDLTRVEVMEGAAVSGTEAREVQLNLPNEAHAVPVGAHLLDGTEVRDRSSLRTILVQGIPFAKLAEGRDLIKIDAEGIEAELLGDAWAAITKSRPTLVVEVLPDSERLATLIAKLARFCDYQIQVIPAYGMDRIVTVTPEEFTATTPARFNSKDVVLSQKTLVS